MANETIYPYGTNGQLPSSIGVINDLTTGGADKALSAEMGTRLSGYKTIDLSTYTKVSTLILTGNGKWDDLSPYKSIFVPIDGGEIYEVTSNNNYGITYTVLSSDSHTTGDTPAYATGYSGKITISAGNSSMITMPNDAEYLWFLVVGDNSIDKTPSSMKLIVGSIIDDMFENKIVDNLTDGGTKKALSAEQGRVLLHKIESTTLSLSDYPSVNAFIATTTNKWVVNYQNYACKLIPLLDVGKYIIKAAASVGCGYALLSSNSYSDGASPNYADGYSAVKFVAAGSEAEITVETSELYLYVYTYTTVDTTPDSITLLSELDGIVDEIVTKKANAKSVVPTSLSVGDKTNIIYTIDDFLMAHEYDTEDAEDQGTLKFSNDLGKTWVSVENTFGTITNAFMFADGTFMMGCKQSDGCRVYWTRDFDTFTQATVLDYNGNPYSLEAGKTRFYILKPKSYHTYVNGVEHYCFWDYIISTTTNPRMWYAISDENGVTVRAAFAFGLSTLNGSTIPARHGHAFDYNPYDGYFYALTGDSVSECHVMKGRYTNNNGVHTWTWEKLATGGGYKLTSISYDEGNLYGITDYTEASLADSKGVVSIPIDKIGLTETNSAGVVCPAKLRYWFHATKDFMKQGSYYSNPTDAQIAAMSGIVVDNHGWRFVGTDYLGGSKHMIAKGGHNFVWVNNNKGLKFGSFIGPNNNGDVYVSGGTPSGSSSVSGEEWLRISRRGLYNLTEIMRNSGATDFFDGYVGTPY